MPDMRSIGKGVHLAFDRYPMEVLIGLLLGVLIGWGVFGSVIGALCGYFFRVLRRQLAAERREFNHEESVPGGLLDDEKQEAKRQALAEAYRVLGVDSDSEVESIRKVYRSLAASFHPDGMVALTDEQRRDAEEAFLRIRSAWECIARERGARP